METITVYKFVSGDQGELKKIGTFEADIWLRQYVYPVKLGCTSGLVQTVGHNVVSFEGRLYEARKESSGSWYISLPSFHPTGKCRGDYSGELSPDWCLTHERSVWKCVAEKEKK